MNSNPFPENKLVFPLNVLKTPFCGDLRSKKFYMRDEILTSADDYRDASGHIFCYHTQMPVGPDGFRVDPDDCGPDRPCYRSAFAKPEEYSAVFKKARTTSEA
jgi:hypothetical protein